MNKHQEMTDSTRKKIIDAFWEIYKIERIESIPIKTITFRAQVHRSTFYRYFIDIYDLLRQDEEELLQQISQDITGIIYKIPDLNFQTFSEATSDLLKNYAEKVFFLTRQQSDPFFRNKLEKLFRKNFISISHLPAQIPELDYLITLMFNMILTNLEYWWNHKDTITLEQITALSRRLIGSGISEITG